MYDYHPVLPVPDAEAPEQSLGDCAICMDAILLDSSLRRRSEDKIERQMSSSKVNVKARTSGFLNAMQKRMVSGGAKARKSYSLAPCHHLFVSETLFLLFVRDGSELRLFKAHGVFGEGKPPILDLLIIRYSSGNFAIVACYQSKLYPYW